MKLKSALPALALLVLSALPAKADFFTAAITRRGWIEVDVSSIQHLNNGTAKFITKEVEAGRVRDLKVELVDCWSQRAMFLELYNIDSDSWIQNPNPQWYSFNRNSVSNGIRAFVCSSPGRR